MGSSEKNIRAQKLERIRTAIHYSQREFSELLNTNYTYYSKLEGGALNVTDSFMNRVYRSFNNLDNSFLDDLLMDNIPVDKISLDRNFYFDNQERKDDKQILDAIVNLKTKMDKIEDLTKLFEKTMEWGCNDRAKCLYAQAVYAIVSEDDIYEECIDEFKDYMLESL